MRILIMILTVLVCGVGNALAEEPVIPTDKAVIPFDTKLGVVTFNHQLHADLSFTECTTCHHTLKPGETVKSCHGNIHDPSRIVIDLSGFIAGYSNVMLQFHFNSNGEPQGDLWQIDDIQLEAFDALTPAENLPNPASGPNPADGATGVEPGSDIEWTAGLQTDSHDVYLGIATPLGTGEFRGNQLGPAYAPGPLELNTTYYWRVDEVNAEGTKRGCTWSFTTQKPLAEIIFSHGFEGDGGN